MGDPIPLRFCPACGAPIERRFVYGRDRPVCPSCGYIHFVDPKVAAAAFVEQGGQVLLVRRAVSPEKGRWTLPAGFVEADEDPAATAARECLEETGLEIEVQDLMEIVPGREHPRGASIVLVYRARVVAGRLQPQDDVDQAGFFSPDEVPPLAFKATRRVITAWQSGSPGSLPDADR